MTGTEDPGRDPGSDFSTLFEFLPIGAYRSTPEGRQLRANPALVRLNGFASEAEQVADVNDIGLNWYVQPGRRATFQAMLERNGQVLAFESEVYRYKTRERIWVSENAHVVRDAQGRVLYYEGTVEDISERVRQREAAERERRHLQQIVDMVPGVLYRILIKASGHTELDYISPNVERLFGVTVQAARRDIQTLRQLRHPEDREAAMAEIAACEAAGRSLNLEYRVLLQDGRVRWIHQTNTTAASEDGCIVRVGLLMDITDRKEAELALRDTSEVWRRALEGSGDGMWDWNLATGQEFLSPQCLALYGYEPGELPGGPEALDDLTHPDDIPGMRADRAAHLAGQTPSYLNEHRVRCKDGSYKWILSRGVVISRAPDGRPLRMVGTHTDVSERKEAQALRFDRDRAAAADLAKSQFLSRVSHELRTPLNAVLGFAQLLELDPELNDRQHDWVRQVLSSGQHLLALVDDLLDLSSLQTGQLPLQCQTVDLQAALQEACTMLVTTAQSAQVRLDNTAGIDQPRWVRADRKRLMQIVSNLLSNAIKYNRVGGWVRITVQQAEGEQIELCVSDSGPGLTPEAVARLFNPFERLGAAHGAIPGTGLGLALSRELAQAMGGSLGVHSEPGVGSTFSLRLPKAVPG